MKSKYGIIPSLNTTEPQICELIASEYKKRNFDGIILNGNFTQHFIEKNKIIYDEYSSRIIEALAKSGIEVFVNPGLLETEEHEEIMNNLTSKYSNLIDTLKNPIIQKKDYELIFMPGFHEEAQNPYIHFTHTIQDVQNITDKIKNPEKTILFSSTAPLFKTPRAVDYKRLWKIQEDLVFYDMIKQKNRIIKAGSKIPEESLKLFNMTKEPIPSFSNEGNELLSIIYKNKGLQKIILNYNEHQSIYHDWKEQPTPMHKITNELIANTTTSNELIQTQIYLNDADIFYSIKSFERKHLVN